MAKRLLVVSDAGDVLVIYQLDSGLIASIDPAHAHARPFEGSDVFKTVSGQDVHQRRPGVFVVAGGSTEYRRVTDD